MRTDAEIQNSEDFLDELESLATTRSDLAEQIKAHAIRAVREFGATRMSTAAAANVSRPTLNSWLGE